MFLISPAVVNPVLNSTVKGSDQLIWKTPSASHTSPMLFSGFQKDVEMTWGWEAAFEDGNYPWHKNRSRGWDFFTWLVDLLEILYLKHARIIFKEVRKVTVGIGSEWLCFSWRKWPEGKPRGKTQGWFRNSEGTLWEPEYGVDKIQEEERGRLRTPSRSSFYWALHNQTGCLQRTEKIANESRGVIRHAMGKTGSKKTGIAQGQRVVRDLLWW